MSEPTEQRDTRTLAGKFAEALGLIEDVAHWLTQVNAQFDPEQYADEIRLVRDYGLPSCNPVMRFWTEADKAEEELKDILRRLQYVEPLVPKEAEPRNIGGWSEPMQQLMDAIGRHPTAESDPSVIDAVNAVENALQQVVREA